MPHAKTCRDESFGHGCDVPLMWARDAVFDGISFEFQYWFCSRCEKQYLMAKSDWPPWFYYTHQEASEAIQIERRGGKAPKPVALRQQAIQAARLDRDEALARVEEAADPTWNAKAYDAIVEMAYRQEEIVADDLWDQVGQPREPRASGPQFLKAARNGFIRKSGRHRPSARRHATELIVWESLVFGQQPQVVIF